MSSSYKITTEAVKAAAQGREVEILRQVAGIDESFLDGKHHPCPKCGGKDRFRLIDRDAGAILCNQCFGHDNGDFIAAVQWAREISFADALKEIVDYLGLKPNVPSPTVIEPVAVEKRTDYLYQDESGETPYKVVRIDPVHGKKKYVQYHWEKSVWRSGLKGRSFIPLPYHLPDLLQESVRTIYIPEGEKCADALRQIIQANGLGASCAVTTISGGSNNWKRLGTFADRFCGASVVLLSDNDAPGRKAAFEGVEVLTNVEGLEGLSLVEFNKDSRQEDAEPRYDVADWIEEKRYDGCGDGTILDDFFTYVQVNGHNASPELVKTLGEKIRVDSSHSSDESKNGPFPIDTFPKLVRDYCVAAAVSTNVDVSFTALAAMTALSAVIGRQYKLDYRDWGTIRPIINGICIGNSGTGKSPAIHRAIFPLSDAQKFINAEELRSQKRVDQMNKGLKAKDREPYRLFPKVLLTDTTTESLYADLHDSEALHVRHGLLGYYDEIALLFHSMDAYKSGSADLSRFLLITDGNFFECSRKTGLRKITASNPHFPIIGGIQPSSLVATLKSEPELIDRGFVQRFLYAFPAPIKKQVTPPLVPVELKNEYQALFRVLLNQSLGNGQPSENLSFSPYDLQRQNEVADDDSEEEFEPIQITLSPGADEVVNTFIEKTFDEETSLTEVVNSYWMKTWMFLLRIVLLFHVVKLTLGESNGNAVDRKTAEDVVVLINWFRREFLKLLSVVPREGHNIPCLIEQSIVDRITEKTEGQSKRDLKRMFSRFNKEGGTEEIEKVLNKLCAERRIVRQTVHANGKSKEIYLAP